MHHLTIPPSDRRRLFEALSAFRAQVHDSGLVLHEVHLSFLDSSSPHVQPRVLFLSHLHPNSSSGLKRSFSGSLILHPDTSDTAPTTPQSSNPTQSKKPSFAVVEPASRFIKSHPPKLPSPKLPSDSFFHSKDDSNTVSHCPPPSTTHCRAQIIPESPTAVQHTPPPSQALIQSPSTPDRRKFPKLSLPAASETDPIPHSHVELFLSSVATISAIQTMELNRDNKTRVQDDVPFGKTNPIISDPKAESEVPSHEQKFDKSNRTPQPLQVVVTGRKSNENPRAKLLNSRNRNRRTMSASARITSTSRPFKCDRCPSSFDRCGHLQVHILAVHEKKRPFSCNLCENSFGHSSSLLRHVRTVHQETPAVGSSRLSRHFRAVSRTFSAGNKSGDDGPMIKHSDGEEECDAVVKRGSRASRRIFPV